MTQDIVDQRERLETVRARERQLRDLRACERELEVDCIACEAALGPIRSAGGPDLIPRTAAAIAGALDRRDELREQIRNLEQRLSRAEDAGIDRRRQLQAGAQALNDWLEAPRAHEPSRSRLAIKAGLLGVTVAILCAAWAVHVAFLVLLFPMVGATSFMLGTNQDAKWRQLGAERQFETTGLDPPPVWDDSAVQARARSLADELKAASHATPSAVDLARDVPAELDAATLLLQEQTEHLSAALASAGLTMQALDEEFAKGVRLVAQAHRARQNLERIKVERKAASAELETARDGLFRFLARHGEAPKGGTAETADLAAGLERVAARRAAPE